MVNLTDLNTLYHKDYPIQCQSDSNHHPQGTTITAVSEPVAFGCQRFPQWHSPFRGSTLLFIY